MEDAPGNHGIHVHLRHGGLGVDEIRYALESEGWTVTTSRGVGGMPLQYLVKEG
ncbi:hypothetical protein [Streptomyces vinaceus]|uniref:hypothetical protein n=1 Tax=Streptomyces vinaceus TaxID=1960 RepID=UPI003801556A